MGEGASDFFAYSVNGDTTLAEYTYSGGLRSINAKTYADWFCFFGFFCEPHDDGEIFAGTYSGDIRERLRTNLVGGSESAAINESHQLLRRRADVVAACADDARHAGRDAAGRRPAQSRLTSQRELLQAGGSRSPAAGWA